MGYYCWVVVCIKLKWVVVCIKLKWVVVCIKLKWVVVCIKLKWVVWHNLFTPFYISNADFYVVQNNIKIIYY